MPNESLRAVNPSLDNGESEDKGQSKWAKIVQEAQDSAKEAVEEVKKLAKKEATKEEGVSQADAAAGAGSNRRDNAVDDLFFQVASQVSVIQARVEQMLDRLSVLKEETPTKISEEAKEAVNRARQCVDECMDRVVAKLEARFGVNIIGAVAVNTPRSMREDIATIKQTLNSEQSAPQKTPGF